MIIDFRIRPVFKSFMDLDIIKTWQLADEQFANDPDPRKRKPTAFERLPVPSVIAGDIDLMVKEMEDAHIVHGVISGRKTLNPLYGDVDNADIYELIQKYPGRFSGSGGISPLAPNAAEEVEKCARDYKFKGITVDGAWCLPAIYHNDPSMEAIFDLCQQYELVLSLGMSGFIGPDLSYCDPGNLVPILKKFKKVKVVFSHACWPKVQEALGVAFLCDNVYLAPDCYYFVRNMPFFEEFTRAANSWLKYRFLFATGYPIRGFEQCVEDWKQRGLEADALQRSLYDNAAELLGM